MNYDYITEKDTSIITHLSLCTGYEGIGMGLRTVLPTLREIAYVEREGFCCANLENKMQKGQMGEAPIFTDVKTFPYEKFRGLVDIMSFGFPCQPFSQAGLRKATEDPRHLFPYLAEGIRVMQPSIVFAENVEGILSCKTGEGEPVVKYVGRTLEEMGYRTEVGIFSASEIGAPHQRKRVFFLGISDSVRSGLCRGGSSEECRDDSNGIQSNEGERNELRSEVERCSIAPMGNTEHDGPSTEQKLRSSDSSSEVRGQKEKGEAGELERTSRPNDGTSFSGCEGNAMANTNGDRHREDTRRDREEKEIQREHREKICRGLPNGTSCDEGSMGNTINHGNTCPLVQPSIQGCEELVNTESELRQHETEQKGRDSIGAASQGRCEELVDTNTEGLQGLSERQEWNSDDPWATSQWMGTFPARPNQDQYEWEQPRVLEKGIPQSELGGTVDGTTDRVDRLRLLGNGVVPYTAAKAFATLLRRFYE
ncbi:DNA methyltransferase [Phage C75C1]|nr:DNA methyltransferase [Phage C75C1]